MPINNNDGILKLLRLDCRLSDCKLGSAERRVFQITFDL